MTIKITHEDRVNFLKREIETLDKKLIRNAAGEIAAGQTRMRYLQILKDLLETLEPKDKPSGVSWGTPKNGGFEMHFYMSKNDLDQMQLPQSDADMVNELLHQNTSPSVCNALAIICGHWILNHRETQNKLAQHVAVETGVDATKH